MRFSERQRYELARQYRTAQGSSKAIGLSMKGYIADRWCIYSDGSPYDPYNPRFRGSEFLRNRLLEGRSRISNKSLYNWINRAKVLSRDLGDEIDWRDSAKLSESGIEISYRPVLHQIWSKVRMETLKGHLSPYLVWDVEDLKILQWLHQLYSDSEMTTFDFLVISDEYRFRQISGRCTDDLDQWLTFKPWEGGDNCAGYIKAIDLGTVIPARPWLEIQFDRPFDCYPYNLPSQIINKFVPEPELDGRDVGVVGLDPVITYDVMVRTNDYVVANKKDVVFNTDFMKALVVSPDVNYTVIKDKDDMSDDDAPDYEELDRATNNLESESGFDVGDSEPSLSFYEEVKRIVKEAGGIIDEDPPTDIG